MKLSDRIYIVGSGDAGIGVSGPFDCTVYLIDGKSELVLIDSGAGVDVLPIVENIKSHGFDPEKISKILLTHAHGDHSGGAKKLSEICKAEVFALPKSAEFVRNGDIKAISLEQAIKAHVYPDGYKYEACPVKELYDGQEITVGDIKLKVIATDGHSLGHGVYLWENGGEKVLFSGDSIMQGGKISLQSTWDCDLQEYIKSCRKIYEIKPDVFLPSHGAFSMSRGFIHINKAIEVIDNLGVPKNYIGD